MLAEMGVRVWWPQRAADSTANAQPQVLANTDAYAHAHADLPAVNAPADAQVRPAQRPVAPAPAAVTAPAPAAVTKPAAEVLVGQPLADGVDAMDWALLQTTVAHCQACSLCAHRQQAVFGVGDVQADWLFIGDPQVETEGQQGEPFVGQSKQLLDNMLKAVGLSAENTKQGAGKDAGTGAGTGAAPGGVYLTSPLKCRLPGGRNPSPQELATCAPYLARQVALVQPKVIVLMGRFSVSAVLQSSEPLGKLRGQVHSFQGVPVVVTYHPDALLRNLPDKAKAWADLVLALQVVRGVSAPSPAD
jgi:uracil-DNA glycosylase